MYIPEFWCGVAATIGVEIVLIIIAVIATAGASSGTVTIHKNDKEDKQ